MKTRTTTSLLRQTIAMLPILMLLSACGGNEPHLGAADEIIEISVSDESQTIDRSRPYELIISGSRNIITIASNNQITQLTISGSNNVVTVSNGATIDSLTFTGNDNTVINSSGNTITTVADQGIGNNLN